MAKKYTKKQVKTAKKAVNSIKKASPGSVIMAIIMLIIAIGGYFAYDKYFKNPYIAPTGELEFHFMELGNEFAGDCVYVRAGDNDILIDGGSRANSLDDITEYLGNYVTDGTLEFVIVTHADQDHIATFASKNNLFGEYKCEIIIDFPLTNKSLTTQGGNTSLYGQYVENRNNEVQVDGAKHFTALECYNETKVGAQRIYNLSEDGNIKLEILYNYYYEHNTDDENDYSVCVQFHHGSRKFLFTGDLEHSGEEKLAEKYDFTQVELFKAGHHGSPTSSTERLLKEIKPKICVACCCAGSVEYTDYLPKTFPSEEFYNRVSVYTDKIFVPSTINRVVNASNPTKEYEINNKKVTITNYDNGTQLKSLHGDITVISNGNEREVKVVCTGEQVVLKDTDWFKQMSLLWQQSPR